MSTVAVVDIGSNSIKVLVARTGAHGLPEAVWNRTIEARISAGISLAVPQLSDEGMARGLAAITELLDGAALHHPDRVALVATSAVRDAANGADFRRRVRTVTGHDIRILTGPEEANLIGRGLTCDPALRQLQDFLLFDLGGGSLECLAFADRKIQLARSLQLGCVRLTEKFIARRQDPVPAEILAALSAHTASVLHASGFRFDSSRHVPAVGTGGTLTTVRAIFAAEQRQTLVATSPELPITAMRALLERLRLLSLAERRAVPGLSFERADVFPAALATLITVAEVGGFSGYHHSFYNLRHGLAAALLGD
jgi:exopolyphosphatase/guanosine-5'-triphosphate,3'-diphosphate pyrophosphatase